MPSQADLTLRIPLLKNIPLFSSLSPVALNELAALFEDVSYSSQELLCLENDIVDSVFVIVSGEAVVSRQEKGNTQLLAVLHPGETIGLSDVGIFSKTGLRTATITANTSIHLLRLNLDDLHQFLASHPTAIPDMQQVLAKILRQNFIKQVQPFANISLPTLQRVMEELIEIEVPAETILFKEGDEANCCYLLETGRVEISVIENNKDKVLANLHSGALFGELALLIENQRNATATTKTPCKLLQLNRNTFKTLVAEISGAFDALTNMMMDRHRPKQCPGITIHKRENAEKKIIYILKNEEQGAYFQMSEESLFVWNMLNGDNTLKDISLEFFFEFNKLAAESIGELILRLMQTGFVKMPTLATYIERPKLPWWIRTLSAIRKTMQYEYSIKNVDAYVTKLYNKVGYLFFTKTAHIVMPLLAITGLLAFMSFFPHVGPILKATPNAWLLLILLGPVSVLTVPFHELAHALTTKAYGFQVHRFGVGWFWLGPMAFADTSDMWLAPRRARITVNLAGIYVDIVSSGLLSLLAWSLQGYSTLAVFLWLLALYHYLLAFLNLDTLFELDGYYVLMDILDKPNLRKKAIQWLLNDFKKTWTSYKLLRKNFPFILYWIISITFVFFAAYVAFVVQSHVLNNALPEKIGHVEPSHFRYALSVAVIVLSFISLYSKIKQQSYIFHR